MNGIYYVLPVRRILDHVFIGLNLGTRYWVIIFLVCWVERCFISSIHSILWKSDNG